MAITSQSRRGKTVRQPPSMPEVPRNTILQGDALTLLRDLPSRSVHSVITSPPYYALRSYLPEGHPDKSLEMGLEPTLDAYLDRLVAVFDEVYRVLRRDGVCWLNLGDAYANDERWGGATSGKHAQGLHGNTGVGRVKHQTGLKPKDLMLIPFRVALALQQAGWWVRQVIVWSKQNAMPESVTDRCTTAHEYVLLLTRSEHYYFDKEAIAEPVSGGAHARARSAAAARTQATKTMKLPANWDMGAGAHGRYHRAGRSERNERNEREPGSPAPGVTPKSAAPGEGIKANASFHAATAQFVPRRNRRSVWECATQPFPDAHFATFPEALVEPMVLAGTSPRCCEHCGAPWERVMRVEREQDPTVGRSALRGAEMSRATQGGPANRAGREFLRVASRETTGWRPGCRCADNTGSGRALILDPFMGSGTVAVVAERHGRDYLGLELSAEYIAIAEQRIAEARLVSRHKTRPRAAEQAGAQVVSLWETDVSDEAPTAPETTTMAETVVSARVNG